MLLYILKTVYFTPDQPSVGQKKSPWFKPSKFHMETQRLEWDGPCLLSRKARDWLAAGVHEQDFALHPHKQRQGPKVCLIRDREIQIHPARRKSKQTKVKKERRKQGILASCKHLIYRVQHHQSGTLPQTFLPVAHGVMWPKVPSPTTLPHACIAMALKKAPAASVQFLWTLLSANMLILLEMLVIFESN